MISLLLTLLVIGVIAWAAMTIVPVPPPIARIILVVAVLIALLVVARFFGVVPSFPR